MKNTTINGIEIHEVSITSNNFWSIDEFCFINDIGYTGTNLLPLNEDVLSCRIFQIDLFGLTEQTDITTDSFFEIKNPNYILKVANAKIV